MKPRLKIVGDHSKYHAGCAAVFRSLVSLAEMKGWSVVGPNDEYDALLMNGEGSMHHGSRNFHMKMKLLAKAVEDGKPAHLVNSVWQENPSDYDDVLRGLSSITVREVRSRADLLKNHGIEARVVPDVSLVEPVGFAFFPINFKKLPARTDFYIPDRGEFGHTNTYQNVRLLPFNKMSWSRAVKSLRTASYLVTGRQHAVYAACKARIPFIASEGNTHKIRGLIETAGVDIPIADHPNDIPSIMPLIGERLGEFEKLFDWLERVDYAAVMPSPSEAPQEPLPN